MTGMVMPPWPTSLPDVFLGSAAVATGVLTRGQLRNRSMVVPVLKDVYRPAHVAHTHLLTCRAAVLVAPGAARLTGASLATVLGVPLLRAEDRVTMVVPRRAAARIEGVDLREAVRGPMGDRVRYGMAVVRAERMAFDLAVRQPLETAVARLDAVAHAGLVDLDALRTWLVERHDDHVVAVRRAAVLADPRAQSHPESVVRVRLLAIGLPVTPQVVVRDARGFAGRVDLAIEHLRLAVEYDGRWHRDVAQFSADRARLNRLREAGWTVVHVTAETLRRPGDLEDLVLREVARLSVR